MDKHFIGLAVSERSLQHFASNQSLEKVMKDSGYDFVAGPYNTAEEAKAALADFGDYAAFTGWRRS